MRLAEGVLVLWAVGCLGCIHDAKPTIGHDEVKVAFENLPTVGHGAANVPPDEKANQAKEKASLYENAAQCAGYVDSLRNTAIWWDGGRVTLSVLGTGFAISASSVAASSTGSDDTAKRTTWATAAAISSGLVGLVALLGDPDRFYKAHESHYSIYLAAQRRAHAFRVESFRMTDDQRRQASKEINEILDRCRTDKPAVADASAAGATSAPPAVAPPPPAPPQSTPPAAVGPPPATAPPP